MPTPRKNKRYIGNHFVWILTERSHVWWADGRSNSPNVGRHSLGTKDRTEAFRLVQQLDTAKAVEYGLAEPEIAVATAREELPLAVGRKLYEDHVGRSRLIGGARASTQKRYRPVLDKLAKFLNKRGIATWNGLTDAVLEAYLGHLEKCGLAYRTQYLEGNTIKAIVAFLIEKKELPAEARLTVKLKKPQGTDTYCWRTAEVLAILEHARGRPELRWLHDVLATLAYTGMRIGEVIALRWSNLDLSTDKIYLVDETASSRRGSQPRQTLKGGQNRSFPIHPDLKPILEAIAKGSDGYVFRGPRLGRLKADTVRNIFIRDVLRPLAAEFPTPVGEIGFAHGRLHSFRHFFCSWCVNGGKPQQTVMAWLGHKDSKLVAHYYHLLDEESGRQMAGLTLSKQSPSEMRGASSGAPNEVSEPESHG